MDKMTDYIKIKDYGRQQQATRLAECLFPKEKTAGE